MYLYIADAEQEMHVPTTDIEDSSITDFIFP